jgi:hypothetical protein
MVAAAIGGVGWLVCGLAWHRVGRLRDLLGKHRMTNALVEGGGALLGSFFDQNLADEYHIYIAPILIGGNAATGPLHAQGAATVENAPRLPVTNKLAFTIAILNVAVIVLGIVPVFYQSIHLQTSIWSW